MHLNGSEGIKPQEYKCKLCNDTGWFETEKGGYSFVSECRCGKLQRDRINGKLEFASIPQEFASQTIENFDTEIYSTEQNRSIALMAKTISKRYVEQFEEIRESGKGLYFYSSVKGSGKTRLATSIANDLIRQKMVSAKFATTIQILDKIKATWGKSDQGEQNLIYDIISVPVLIIDDIGVEPAKDWVNERFYSILNGRMIEKKITIFTSNCRMEELNLDERIVNRIMKMTLPIEFPNESVRMTLARRENDDLLDRLLGV